MQQQHQLEDPNDFGSADLFDLKHAAEQVGYVFGSIRRHRKLWLFSFLGMVIAAGLLARHWPRTYNAESKLLVERNQLAAVLGNPNRSLPHEEDPLTRAAYETILSRDNLVAIIRSTDLINHWDTTRAPLLKFKDVIFSLLWGKATPEERLDAMVGTLEKRLYVLTGDGTLTIGVDWPHPQMSYQLVEAAQQNFLEARHVSEVTAISQAISILEAHANQTQTAIEEAMAEVQRVSENHKKDATVKLSSTRAVTSAPSDPVPSQEINQLRFLIAGKRRAINDLEDAKNRRLIELQAQLTEQKVIYSPNHPSISDLERRIVALQQDSPQLITLKREEESLLRSLRDAGGTTAAESRTVGRSTARALLDNPIQRLMPSLLENPVVMVAQDQLRINLAKYHDLLMRMESAKIELDSARAAFKSSYSVVKPAQIPKRPKKPNVSLLFLGGLFASAMFSISLVVMVDIRRGRIVERWQVERTLGLPMLAEVKLARPEAT